MTNTYETVFILHPVLSDDQVRETVEKFEGILANKEAKINHRENWGLKKLAYPIQKKKSGFYTLLEFSAEGDVIDNFELELRRDERVMRYITVKLDKYAQEFAEKRRQKMKSNA
ncbi:MAG: 30S ribosomal protein S6 [Cryomorphaceae bacterium]|jgi:small subunit ribosomal protein S6|nr:30S ribosomal protein S6 [Cryomorphaceae bacterium]